MSIEGRINIDCLFHDKEGTSSLKVLSLASSTAYTTGKVIMVTGTAAASRGITWNNYRDSSGAIVSLADPAAIAFSWSGTTFRDLRDSTNSGFILKSKGNQVAFSLIDPGLEPGIELTAPNETDTTTGTYTIIMWGAN
jgi:hypothetical protein